jgi:DNA-binding transcriptional MerR regulator
MAYFNNFQVAQRLNIPVATLRHYIRKGWVRCGSLPSGRIRTFSERQVREAETLFEKGGRDAEIAAENDNSRSI